MVNPITPAHAGSQTVEDNGCSAFADCMFLDCLRVSVLIGAALTAAVLHRLR